MTCFCLSNSSPVLRATIVSRLSNTEIVSLYEGLTLPRSCGIDFWAPQLKEISMSRLHRMIEGPGRAEIVHFFGIGDLHCSIVVCFVSFESIFSRLLVPMFEANATRVPGYCDMLLTSTIPPLLLMRDGIIPLAFAEHWTTRIRRGRSSFHWQMDWRRQWPSCLSWN